MSNKNKVRILKAARKLIKSGKRDYICYAIDDVDNRLTKDGWYLRYIISERLQGIRALEDWLWIARGISTYNEFGTIDKLNKLKLRETRLAWIDSLIEEFS